MHSVDPKLLHSEQNNTSFPLSGPLPPKVTGLRDTVLQKNDEMYQNLVKLCYYYFCKKKPDMWNATKTTGASRLVLKSAS